MSQQASSPRYPADNSQPGVMGTPLPPPPQLDAPRRKGRGGVVLLVVIALLVIAGGVISSVAIIAAKNNLGPAPGPNVSPTAPAQTTTPPSAPVRNATWNIILNHATSSL